jgi:hypothetical protein
MLGAPEEPERTDQQMAAEDVAGELIAVIQLPVWSWTRAAGMDHALLVAAEHGGEAAINALLPTTNHRPVRIGHRSAQRDPRNSMVLGWGFM